jgi:hypothetical protein
MLVAFIVAGMKVLPDAMPDTVGVLRLAEIDDIRGAKLQYRI